MSNVLKTIRYFAGWADKNHGQTIEVSIYPCSTIVYPLTPVDGLTRRNSHIQDTSRLAFVYVDDICTVRPISYDASQALILPWNFPRTPASDPCV